MFNEVTSQNKINKMKQVLNLIYNFCLFNIDEAVSEWITQNAKRGRDVCLIFGRFATFIGDTNLTLSPRKRGAQVASWQMVLTTAQVTKGLALASPTFRPVASLYPVL